MDQAEKQKDITFEVDDEEVTSVDRELTVRAVILLANVDPDTHYLQLVKGGKPGTEFKDLDELIKIHEGIEFVTVYSGPTHVS